VSDCLRLDQIGALVSGSSPPEERARAESHIEECAECRERVDQGREALETRTAIVEEEPPQSGAGENVEGYQVLSEISRGGQGVVYKAVQTATHRTVALKVLREGPYATERERRRFEREIDLAAGLDHPNIVTVYESGMTEDRPYFAMQYVRGQPLDRHVREKESGVEETLRLFLKVCGAVNHAHQRGVIHRDLKPANVLIDGEGEPHVLDFGLAKAAGAALTGEGRPVTETGQFLGTLAYASPEQTKGDPGLIDIRTDVYALGVMLYEALTGEYPLLRCTPEGGARCRVTGSGRAPGGRMRIVPFRRAPGRGNAGTSRREGAEATGGA